MKQRLEYINWLRAIATIAVIVLHVSANNWYHTYVGSAEWSVFMCFSAATRFAVPIFVMISGALFLREEYSLNVKRLYRHNIGRLLMFLVFWAIVYEVYHRFSAENWEGEFSIVVDIFRSLLSGQTQVHLWFVYMIIGIYIVCPIIKIFVNHASKEILMYFLLIFFSACCLPSFLGAFDIEPLQMLTTNINKLDISVTSGYVGYFVLGHYLETYPLNKKQRYVLYGLGLVSLMATIVMTYGKSVVLGTHVETYFRYMMPMIFIMSMAVFVLLKNMNPKPNNFIDTVSTFSLGIYGVHMLVIFVMWKHGIDTFILPGIISVPLISSIVFICSLLIVCVMRKVPVLGKVIT